jgi:hypothetical protein
MSEAQRPRGPDFTADSSGHVRDEEEQRRIQAAMEEARIQERQRLRQQLYIALAMLIAVLVVFGILRIIGG